MRIVDPKAVARARDVLPRPGDISPLADVFGALSDATRLRMLIALSAGPLCVCDLSETVGASQSAVSHQLRLLRMLDLVTYEREGKRAVYRLSDDHVRTLLDQGRDHVDEKAER